MQNTDFEPRNGTKAAYQFRTMWCVSGPVDKPMCLPGGFRKTTHWGFGPWLVSTKAVATALVPAPQLQASIASLDARWAEVDTRGGLGIKVAVNAPGRLAYSALTAEMRTVMDGLRLVEGTRCETELVAAHPATVTRSSSPAATRKFRCLSAPIPRESFIPVAGRPLWVGAPTRGSSAELVLSRASSAGSSVPSPPSGQSHSAR